MNDTRQGLVQRLKIVERERDGLEDARIAAEAYMDKERECTEAQCTIYQVKSLTDSDSEKAKLPCSLRWLCP